MVEARTVVISGKFDLKDFSNEEFCLDYDVKEEAEYWDGIKAHDGEKFALLVSITDLEEVEEGSFYNTIEFEDGFKIEELSSYHFDLDNYSLNLINLIVEDMENNPEQYN